MITIWLSLLILCLAFVISSDQTGRILGVPVMFGGGTLLYLVGGARAWMRKQTTIVLVEFLLAVCMLTGGILSLLRLGGFL